MIWLMPRPWTKEESNKYKNQLVDLYIRQNKSLKEVADILQIKQSTVFDRLKRFDIETCPEKKVGYQNRRDDVTVPKRYTPDLSEFFGIMLGDGNLTHFQTVVTLGTKEVTYAKYVSNLIKKIFGGNPKISIRSVGCRDVYLGSVAITSWLKKEGLVYNKVKSQVDVPGWIFSKDIYMKRFLKGFFDTDGSVYKLRFGIQLAFTNRSVPILYSLHKMLKKLSYKPSEVSCWKVYITRREDVLRFFRQIFPANPKHRQRFENFIKMRRYSSGNESRL